jgi:cytochrome d ubiquinol oxidase subunit II
MTFDYETLRIIWWVLSGMVLVGFSVTSGFDLGVSILLIFFGKGDDERAAIINTIPSTWVGNQVWFALGLGLLFLSFSTDGYALSFFTLFVILLLALLCLFLRPLTFKFRSTLPFQRLRDELDSFVFFCGMFPALVFGIAFGNLLLGVPFYFEEDGGLAYHGSLWKLLNLFSLTTGLLCVSLFATQGAIFLQMHAEDVIHHKAKKGVLWFSVSFLLLFIGLSYWVTLLDGYHITSEVFPNELSGALEKTVKQEAGLWLDNFGHYPDLWMLPATSVVSGLLTALFSMLNKPNLSLVCSSWSIASVMMTVGCTMFPFIIPSNFALNSSFTVWDFSFDRGILMIMFWAVVMLSPLILLCTSWMIRNLARERVK